MLDDEKEIVKKYTELLNNIYIYKTYEITMDLSSDDGIVSKIYIKPTND